MARCASAAAASGQAAAIAGRTAVPTSGQTSRNRRSATAFLRASSSGRRSEPETETGLAMMVRSGVDRSLHLSPRDGRSDHRAATRGEQDEVRPAGDELDDLGIVGNVGETEARFAVGYHVEQAYRCTAELGATDAALGERAARLLAGAGSRAHARADMPAAANLLERALALGGRASMERPLAIAIIAGLIAQGPLVLLAMPAIYRLLGGARARRGQDGASDQPAS